MRGGVFKRGKTWSYTVYLGRDAATGKKRYKQVGGFPTRRACEDALRQIVVRVRTSDYADAGSTTVAEFVERWLTATEPTTKPTTAASYRNMLETHLVPTLGSVKLSKLTGLELSALYGELLASGYRKGKTPRGLSPTSVRYVHRIVAKALTDAVRWGLLARSPAANVDPPRKADTEMATWSAEQVREFLQSVAGDRLYALWVLLCTTGMRRGEVLGLRWEDIDLTAARIAVRRASVEVGYDVRSSDPKSAKGRRSVRLTGTGLDEVIVDDETIEAIRQLALPGTAAGGAEPMTVAEALDTIDARLQRRLAASGNHHVYVSLAERLERLRRASLERAEASVEFLREILELAKQVTAAEKMEESAGVAALSLLPDPKVGALTQLLNEYGPKDTPVIVEEVVSDIDAIVRQVRFVGWADTQNGDREVRKEIRLVLKRYALPTTGELFDRTYAYIRENY